MTNDLENTRLSWNIATRNHNAHKGDQAAFFRAGGDVLFPEELELLGELADQDLVHLQCNAGQDSLGLARRGARVTGVDLSDEAIAFARALSAGAGIPAEFVQSEVVSWLAQTERRFDLAFASYGALPWIADIGAWARGAWRVLRPGGALVVMEFHPLVWSFGPDLDLRGDDYFAVEPFREPVGDYVAASGAGLGAVTPAAVLPNTTPATAYQTGLGQIVTAFCQAGFLLEIVREYPHSNGCRLLSGLVEGPERTWVMPPEKARLPLMYGLRARKPT